MIAGAALAPLSLGDARAQSKKRVLIMGAGAAGLCAAYELDRAGHDVLIFEAKSIPGGRIHTIRSPFADGLYAEAGPVDIPDAHKLTMHYVREFDLPLMTFPTRPDLKGLIHFGNHTSVRNAPPSRWPVPLREDEAGLSVNELRQRYWFSKIKGVPGLAGDDWYAAPRLQYDRVSLADFWREQGASEGAVRLLRLGYIDQIGEGVESTSTLAIMHSLVVEDQSNEWYTIRGGVDQLPRAFAQRLGSRIRYGSPVVAIKRNKEYVEITVEDASGQHQVKGDYLICAAPFSVLRHVSVTPQFPPKRRRALQEIDSTSTTRVFVQCRERFWEAEGLNGAALTDLPIMSIRHATDVQPGARGILESFSGGRQARRLAAMSADERLGEVIANMTRVHPKLPQYSEGGFSVAWGNDRWALGANPYFKAGQIEEFFPYVQQPEGRVYFAGDLVGGMPGWIQSALASGQLAAAQINSRE